MTRYFEVVLEGVSIKIVVVIRPLHWISRETRCRFLFRSSCSSWQGTTVRPWVFKGVPVVTFLYWFPLYLVSKRHVPYRTLDFVGGFESPVCLIAGLSVSTLVIWSLCLRFSLSSNGHYPFRLPTFLLTSVSCIRPTTGLPRDPPVPFLFWDRFSSVSRSRTDVQTRGSLSTPFRPITGLPRVSSSCDVHSTRFEVGKGVVPPSSHSNSCFL